MILRTRCQFSSLKAIPLLRLITFRRKKMLNFPIIEYHYELPIIIFYNMKVEHFLPTKRYKPKSRIASNDENWHCVRKSLLETSYILI